MSLHVQPAESATKTTTEYYVTPKRESIFQLHEELPLPPSSDEDELHDDGEATSVKPEEKYVTQFATHNFGSLASQYITPYLYRGGSSLDREYGLRRDQVGKFRVGNLKIEIGKDSNIFIANKKFKGTKGLFEILTRNKIQHSEITSHDLKTYKHRENYDPA
jgi:hypothetical protein